MLGSFPYTLGGSNQTHFSSKTMSSTQNNFFSQAPKVRLKHKYSCINWRTILPQCLDASCFFSFSRLWYWSYATMLSLFWHAYPFLAFWEKNSFIIYSTILLYHMYLGLPKKKWYIFWLSSRIPYFYAASFFFRRRVFVFDTFYNG